MPEPQVCVGCRQLPVDPKYRPFCSERCRLADLGRWLTERYRVPGPDPTIPDPPSHGRDADDH